MNIRTLQRGLNYRGRVKAVRQACHIWKDQRYFFVLSFALSKARRGSGYFNVIDTEAVDYVQRRMGGTRAVTAKDVVAAARRTRRAPSFYARGSQCAVHTGRPSVGDHRASGQEPPTVLRGERGSAAGQ